MILIDDCSVVGTRAEARGLELHKLYDVARDCLREWDRFTPFIDIAPPCSGDLKGGFDKSPAISAVNLIAFVLQRESENPLV